jgi:hypothetical protein
MVVLVSGTVFGPKMTQTPGPPPGPFDLKTAPPARGK